MVFQEWRKILWDLWLSDHSGHVKPSIIPLVRSDHFSSSSLNCGLASKNQLPVFHFLRVECYRWHKPEYLLLLPLKHRIAEFLLVFFFCSSSTVSACSFHLASGFLRNTPSPEQGTSSKTTSADALSLLITLPVISRVSML